MAVADPTPAYEKDGEEYEKTNDDHDDNEPQFSVKWRRLL